MKDVPEEVVLLVGNLALLAVATCVGMIAAIVGRRRRGLPILPFEPRRPVPWRWYDVLLIVAISQASVLLVESFLSRPPSTAEPPEAVAVEQTPVEPADEPASSEEVGNHARKAGPHPLVVLIHKEPGSQTVLLAFLAAVVIAPLVEEFLFRLVLQGWLERVEMRLPGPLAIRRWARGALPILISAALFASMHYRPAVEGGGAGDVRAIHHTVLRTVLASLITLAASLGILWIGPRARLVDLGIRRDRLWADIRLGLLAFATLAAPIYTLQALFTWLLPESIVADPFTMVFFATALGLLYFRTHRIVPSITLHTALNATSLALALLLKG